MNAKKYICMAGILLPLAVSAQDDKTLCDFESTDSYKSVSVYDTWAESPFRTGKLEGNVKVVDNSLTDVDALLGYAPNESKKILGVQRSRFGSSIFGALVELKQPFALKKQTQYVHVMFNSPKDGNVMLIGLGKRDDLSDQSDKTEQFWSVPSSQVTAGKWCDIVFPVSGANGITISSLLVVVDRKSPHNLTEDYAVYVDNIVLSTKSSPFFSTAVYPINYEEGQAATRNDRYLNSVSLSTSDGTQYLAVNQNSDKHLYIKKMDEVQYAKVGDRVTPNFSWAGSWMCGYIYIDKDNDGMFNVTYDDNSITKMEDLMTYSYFKGKTSEGTSVSGSPSATPPAFTIPSDMTPGIYRIRYKVDWDNVDPGGNPGPSNKITDNGGAIVDSRINIHAENVNLYRATDDLGGGLNGEIRLADGTPLTGKTTPFGKAFAVKAIPAPGFEFDYVKIRHGYNLEGESSLFQNLQWQETTVKADAFVNGEYTIPASMVDGDIRFVPYFKNTTGIDGTTASDSSLRFHAEKGQLVVEAANEQHLSIVDTLGRTLFAGNVKGTHNIMLNSGVYVVNGKKVLVP